jgi:hypothetical protein
VDVDAVGRWPIFCGNKLLPTELKDIDVLAVLSGEAALPMETFEWKLEVLAGVGGRAQ